MTSALTSMPGLMGKVVSVDELVALIVGLPGADPPRVRNHTVVRRLRPILELVERGPNGSLSRGASYRIVQPPPPPEPDEFLNERWLIDAADRMGGKIKG